MYTTKGNHRGKENDTSSQVKFVDTNFALCTCHEVKLFIYSIDHNLPAMKTPKIRYKSPEKQLLYPVDNLEAKIVVNKAIRHDHGRNCFYCFMMTASIF